MAFGARAGLRTAWLLRALPLGGRVLEDKTALEMVAAWLETEFEGGRHARRVQKISEIEKKTMKRA
jgi:ribose 5-phosphate isomerase RpiB